LVFGGELDRPRWPRVGHCFRDAQRASWLDYSPGLESKSRSNQRRSDKLYSEIIVSIPMLVAYVSDERYAALPDVLLEFEGLAGSFECRSRATGSVHADLPPGRYKVTLQKAGFGAKSVVVDVIPGRPPCQF